MKSHECQFCGRGLTCKNKEDIGKIIEKHESTCKEEKKRRN